MNYRFKKITALFCVVAFIIGWNYLLVTSLIDSFESGEIQYCPTANCSIVSVEDFPVSYWLSVFRPLALLIGSNILFVCGAYFGIKENHNQTHQLFDSDEE